MIYAVCQKNIYNLFEYDKFNINKPQYLFEYLFEIGKNSSERYGILLFLIRA